MNIWRCWLPVTEQMTPNYVIEARDRDSLDSFKNVWLRKLHEKMPDANRSRSLYHGSRL